jgi:RNA polymerase sigma-70 factor (ECF subfamily)
MFRRAAMKVERPLPQAEPGPGPDRARLERMFRDHHELLWRMLRRRGLGPDAAADLAQQAFLIAAERLDAIHRGSERAFLIGTAVRLARSAFRRARLIELADDMDVHAARGGDVGDARSAIDLLDLVLSKIDPPLVEVFVLFELEEMSSPEIARLLEVPLGTVASRLRRAREAFRGAANRVELVVQREGGRS